MMEVNKYFHSDLGSGFVLPYIVLLNVKERWSLVLRIVRDFNITHIGIGLYLVM